MRVQLGLPKLKPLGIPNGNGCNLVVATNASLLPRRFLIPNSFPQLTSPNFPDFDSESIFSMATIPYKEQVGMSWLAYSHPKIEIFFTILFQILRSMRSWGSPASWPLPPPDTAVDFYTAESNPPNTAEQQKVGQFSSWTTARDSNCVKFFDPSSFVDKIDIFDWVSYSEVQNLVYCMLSLVNYSKITATVAVKKRSSFTIYPPGNDHISHLWKIRKSSTHIVFWDGIC